MPLAARCSRSSSATSTSASTSAPRARRRELELCASTCGATCATARSRLAGSFFNTASQLPAPVDQTTDQIEVSASYATRRLQATLGYQLSMFRNEQRVADLVQSVHPGRRPAARAASSRWRPTTSSSRSPARPATTSRRRMRISGDFALGRMTQNTAYLAPTLNAALAPTVPALPAQSLDGRAETFTGGVKLTASPLEALRVTASYHRERRDNQTPVRSYPYVVTDMFLAPLPRSNTPFSFTQDRFKLGGEYRGPGSLRLSGAVEQDYRERSYQEVVETRETTVWAKAGLQARDNLALTLKLAHASRANSTYGTSIWFGYAENPLLRKYYLADRERDSIGARADYTLNEKVERRSVRRRGLRRLQELDARPDLGAQPEPRRRPGVRDLRAHPVARLRAGRTHPFAPDRQRRIRGARLDGAQQGQLRRARHRRQARCARRQARHRRRPDAVAGAQRHLRGECSRRAALPHRQDSRRQHQALRDLQAAARTSGSPEAIGTSTTTRRTGVSTASLPATLPNLLAFGAQAPNYSVNVIRIALRYRF